MARQNKPAIVDVTPFAEIQKLTQAEAVTQLGNTSRAYQRAFVITAKLLRHVEKTLKSTQTVGGLLKKEGIKKTTIDNARYAAKVFDLVEAGKITEAQFDTFTFPDCLAIIRVMSQGSKKRLTADEVAVHVKASGDFEPDLHELYSTGLTVAEAKIAEAAATAAAKTAEKEKVKADAKVKADEEAATAAALAEMEQLKAENAALLAQSVETLPAETTALENPEPLSETPAVTSPAPLMAPDVPTNIVPIASAPRKRTAADLVAALDAVFSDMAGLDADEQAVVARKLIELADIIAETGSHLDAGQRIAA